MNDWFKIRVYANEEALECAIALLTERGSAGCQQFKGFAECYFSSTSDPAQLKQLTDDYLKALKSNTGFQDQATVEIIEVPSQDWHAGWKKNFKPLIISSRFIVKPSWESVDEQEKRQVIEIDPGQAFGTGSHETTQLVVQNLETYFQAGMNFLDIGTGTAILAIAAHKLGAGPAVIFDIDPSAAEAAKINLQLNVDESADFRLFCGTPAALKQCKFDVILANLTKNVILALWKDMLRFTRSMGLLFLSGILVEESAVMRDHFSLFPDIMIVNEQQNGEWTSFVLRKVW